MEVNIMQDIHYTHNNQNEPVFSISFKKSNGSRSHSIEYTVPELLAIRDEITRFLDEYDAKNMLQLGHSCQNQREKEEKKNNESS